MKLTEQTSIEKVRKKIDLQSNICKFDILEMILRSEELKADYNVSDKDLILLFDEIDIKELQSEFELMSWDKELLILYIKAIRLGVLKTINRLLENEDNSRLYELKSKYENLLKTIWDIFSISK